MINLMKNEEDACFAIDDESSSQKQEVNYTGLGVSPGIAIGTAYVHNPGFISVPKFGIDNDKIDAEKDRLINAVEKTSAQIKRLKEKAEKEHENSSEEVSFLLDVYEQMLRGSRLIRGVLERIESKKINAEAAVQDEIDSLNAAFSSMNDPYFSSRIEDIKGVGTRLINNLSNKVTQTFSNLPENTIILASELTPADTASLDTKKVAGFASITGGAQSHTGLLARSLSLPAVIGVSKMLEKVRTGDKVIIDGTYGLVIINPDQETIDKFIQYRKDFLGWRESLAGLKDLPSETVDGHTITINGNIDLPSEAEVLIDSGAEGIGLFRTEYLYMNREGLPTEQEQFDIFSMVVQRMKGKPVTIRTLDIGGDKLSGLLPTHKGSNPALGLRGIRCSLKYQDLLETQFAAILRVANLGKIKILLPMVSCVEELFTAKRILKETYQRLQNEGIALPEKIPELGIMVEVPSAAIMIDSLIDFVDFVSIGSNDLTQYILAIDRTDDEVASLYNPVHPAVLKLIKKTCDAGVIAGKPVCLCGEMAASPQLTALLIGMGISELSMPAANVPTVKQRVRCLNRHEAISLAKEISEIKFPAEIFQTLEKYEQHLF
jgi:phosphotransferase system enzyme I (PtsI)